MAMLSSVTSEASSGQTYLKVIGKTQFNWTIKDIQTYLELSEPIDSPDFSLKVLNQDKAMNLYMQMRPKMDGGLGRGSFDIVLQSNQCVQFRSVLRVTCFELNNNQTDGSVQKKFANLGPAGGIIGTGKIDQIPQDHEDMTISLELSVVESAHN